MNTIVKMKFGSHLYGTSTPQSDTDYKGVALPTWEQVALGKIPKHMEHTSTGAANSKNTADDIDTEIFSIHEFIKLALEGQTVALDMLHAPLSMVSGYNYLWRYIVLHKDKFYTKNSSAFVGYARKQAAKYGVKGSRLRAAEDFILWLKEYPVDMRLADAIADVPFQTREHVQFEQGKNGIWQYVVCGKALQVTCTIGYCLPVIERYYTAYGDRARKAANDEGIDWKAVSHAIRAACQIKELLVFKRITFPRPEAALLLDIKNGKIPYRIIGKMLDDLIDEVEVLTAESDLPEKPDVKFWNDFLLKVVHDIKMFHDKNAEDYKLYPKLVI